MKQCFSLFVGIFLLTMSGYAQDIEASKQHLYAHFPSIFKMKKVKAERQGDFTTYLFKKGNAQYKRTYIYGRSKTCLHNFTIEEDGKRYQLLGDDEMDYLVFEIETYSESQKQWIKSKKTLKCKRSELPDAVSFILRVTQGTLSTYR